MIKVGFIGFGRMGLTHFSILNTHPSIKIVSVCDKSATMMKILKQYANVKTYNDYIKMLDNSDLDCVLISTPGDSHSSIIQECLKRGVHVFVEKPFTMTVSEGQAVINELDGRPLVNQVGYVNRFNEVFMEVRRLLSDAIIGDVVHFSSEMYGATVLKESKSGWRGSRKGGGGCMYEFASHCIDLALYLLGEPDIISGSIMRSIYSTEVEDMVASTFIYNNGLTGNIMANWSDETYRKPVNIVKIFGTGGKIIADKHAYKIFIKKPDTQNGFDQGWNTRYIKDFGKSVRFYLRGNESTRQLDCFIDCIERKSTENISSFSEGFKTDILMDEIARDAANHVTRSISTDDAAMTLRRSVEKQSFWK